MYTVNIPKALGIHLLREWEKVSGDEVIYKNNIYLFIIIVF